MLTSPTGYQTALMRDLQEWRDRLGKVIGQIKALERERDEINRKVVAAEVLLGQNEQPTETAASSMRAAIEALMTDGRIRRPKEIRRELRSSGISPNKLTSHSGAFYNALMRMTNDGFLAKTEDGRYWDPTKSSGPVNIEDMLK